MIKKFNNKAILTTKNPEAFLNFSYESGDTSVWIVPNCNVLAGKFYINGLDVSTYVSQFDSRFALELNGFNTTASFLVYTRELYDYDYNLKFLFYNSIDCSVLINTIDVSIHNRPDFAKINVHDNDSILIDGISSHLILRSNPKLTGNIKIVVDTSYNMFLDTFKVSDILSNKKYRKQRVSGNSVLSNDVRNVFKSLPLGELYSVGNKSSFNISVPKTKYADQYDTTYNYGARTLKDELYTQDNGLLAPLWINSILPEYFSIFRLDGVYNSETYEGSDLSNLAFKYLENSQLIKTWDLKTSPLGTYLNTHLNDLVKTPAPVFLSMTDVSISTAESDPNTWYGIAVDKGVLAGRSETPYFFNKNLNNFTELNAFVTQGFERNNLLCPNLLNLEFIFDDNDVSAYNMNRYFGLYLTENILYKIAYYSDTANSSTRILSMDGKDSSVFINSIVFDISGNISSTYKNRLFVINNGTTLERITNKSQIESPELISVPNENLFTTPVVKKDYKPFITLTINKELQQGEQLRMINLTQNKIYEIYGIDTSATCSQYISQHSHINYPTISQTTFQVGGSISQQLRAIEKAFDLFSEYEDGIFRVGIRGDNWLSLIINDDANSNDEWIFQRITAQTLNIFTDPCSGFNNAANEGDITFFSRLTPALSDVQIVAKDSSFGPINFELFGNRRSIFVNLFNKQNNLLYSFSPSIVDKFVDNLLYQGEDGWYKLIQDFPVTTTYQHTYQYVLDPLSSTTKYLIQTKENIQTINNNWNAYSIKDLNISLMGINSVKDIDYTIYDSNIGATSEYWYKRDGDASTYQLTIETGNNHTFDIRNSYQILSGTGVIIPASGLNIPYVSGDKFNTFFGEIFIAAYTKTIISYDTLNGNRTFKSYKSNATEENLSDYYISNSQLKYSLTTPTVSKWVGLGTDCRNNEFRLIFNASSLDQSFTEKSNFIPTGSFFSDEISYPSYKYLSGGTRNWEDYIFNDINDTVEYNEDGSIYNTIKELMFAKPYVDVFSKLVYSNNDIDNVKNRSSIVHYNDYNQSINTILSGLNLSFKAKDVTKNIIDIKKYDKYRFSFMSTSSKNRDNRRPIEIIINENTNTILMVWYQGNDILNYSLRNSTYIPGKSLLNESNKCFVSGPDVSSWYSFAKVPFIVNNSNVSRSLYEIYGYATSYDSSIVRPYAQLNYGVYGINSIWNAFTNNNVLFNSKFISGLSYNTFSQEVKYSYYPNVNTFTDGVVNYGYKYETNENLYQINTCNLDKFSYFINPVKDFISFYIIKEDNIISSADFAVSPISISIINPRIFNGIYTYNGWYAPKLDNILEFKTNEEDTLVSIVDMDFVLANTNLRLYKDIDQFWYNKVVSTVSDADILAGDAISYSKFNVFKSLWDADYFKTNSTSVDGYESTYEFPSFFGSKLMKLPDYLELSSWNSEISNVAVNIDVVMTFNLTKAINQLFKSNSTFINNWMGLSNADNIIDSYISNEIISYYNINISEIKLEVFYKPFASELLYSIFDSNFIADEKTNYKTELVYEKNEYIYKVTFKKSNNYSYFLKFKLFEK